MIKYQLICEKNHGFEGWFQGSAAYDEQAADGLIRCPFCDSDQVKRALMTPNLASPKQRKSAVPSANDQLPATESAASVRRAYHTAGVRDGFAHDGIKLGVFVGAAYVLHEALRAGEAAVWAPWAKKTSVAVQARVGRRWLSKGGCWRGGCDP